MDKELKFYKRDRTPTLLNLIFYKVVREDKDKHNGIVLKAPTIPIFFFCWCLVFKRESSIRGESLYANPKLSQSMEGVSPRRRTISLGASLDEPPSLKSDNIVLR